MLVIMQDTGDSFKKRSSCSNFYGCTQVCSKEDTLNEETKAKLTCTNLDCSQNKKKVEEKPKEKKVEEKPKEKKVEEKPKEKKVEEKPKESKSDKKTKKE